MYIFSKSLIVLLSNALHIIDKEQTHTYTPFESKIEFFWKKTKKNEGIFKFSLLNYNMQMLSPNTITDMLLLDSTVGDCHTTENNKNTPR